MSPRSSSVRPLVRAALLGCLLALAGPGLALPPSKTPPANQPVTGPQGTLEAVARGYPERSVPAVLGHYTADYRFHTMGDSLYPFVTGHDRAAEEESLRNMFEGGPGEAELQGPVDSLGVFMDGFQEGVDPEHPDSTQHYRVVVVGRFELGIRKGDMRMTTMSRQHVFHMVRGDAARLTPGQPADPDRWYVRRWLEDVSGVLEALGQRQGGCGEPAAPSVGGVPGPSALAIHALTNPACPSLQVTCDLPGAGPARVEVYDVSGRRVNRRDVAAAGPGRVEVEAGKGAQLRPGPYWVRVTQGALPAAVRMVMVAR